MRGDFSSRLFKHKNFQSKNTYLKDAPTKGNKHNAALNMSGTLKRIQFGQNLHSK